MPVALTEEQSALAEAIHAWSAAHHPREAVRAAETGGGAGIPGGFGELGRGGGGLPQGGGAAIPAGCAELGLFGVALPEPAGGSDGSVADLAAGLAAAAEELVPGPVL